MQKALEGLPFVKDVQPMLREGKARLVVEKGKFDEAATAQALKKAGFGGGTKVN